MNIKCSFCQMPYALSRVQMLDALQEMDAHKLSHYDAHCPRCRRATPVQRSRMEVFFPNWREALKQFEAEMKAHPQQEAPLPAPEAVAVAPAESKPVPSAKTESKAEGKTAVKAEKNPATKAKPAKSTAKKPAVKKK